LEKTTKFIIYAPDTYFYKRIIYELSIAFKNNGLDSFYTTRESTLKKIIDQYRYKNDIIYFFLINKTLESSEVSSNIKIINWIQDYKFNGKNIIDFQFFKNQYYYFLINPIAWDLKIKKDINWSILLPAATSSKNQINHNEKFDLDVSFVGFIPPPLNLNQIISCTKSHNTVELKKVLSKIDKSLFHHSTFSLKKLKDELKITLDKFGIAVLSQESEHIFEELIPRTIEREQIMNKLISAQIKFKIYGPKTWREWTEFKKYYAKEVIKYSKLLSIYSSTKINIHNGALGMHWRVMDVLSLGSFLITNKSKFDNMPGGINNYLINEEDFVFYEPGSIIDTVDYYLGNPKIRKEIGYNAKRKIQKFHTWDNRVNQILEDLKVIHSKKNFPTSHNLDQLNFMRFFQNKIII